MFYSTPPLDDERLDAVRALEKETGRTLLAFAPLPVASDRLEEAELAKVQALERELGVVLVAVREEAQPPAA